MEKKIKYFWSAIGLFFLSALFGFLIYFLKKDLNSNVVAVLSILGILAIPVGLGLLYKSMTEYRWPIFAKYLITFLVCVAIWIFAFGILYPTLASIILLF